MYINPRPNGFDIEKTATFAVKVFLLLISLASCAMGIQMLRLRSLGLDEAMLAYSFMARDFLDMTANKLDWNQTAPVLYLYTVKMLTELFGGSEAVLRLFSYLSFVGVLLLLFIVSYMLFSTEDHALASPRDIPVVCYLCPAVFSVLAISLRYATELKPYMSDAFFTLLAILLYLLYNKGKLSLCMLAIFYCLFLWYSSPVCFVIASVFIYEFLCALKSKDTKKLLYISAAGAAVLGSFSANYFYWLRDVAVSDEMVNYWTSRAFPLIPLSPGDLIKIASLYDGIAVSFGTYKYLFSILAFAGMIVFFYKKHPFARIVLISSVLFYVDSSIGKYPVADRLMMFSYPVFVILACFAVKEIAVTPVNAWNNLLRLLLALCLLSTNANWLTYYRNPYLSGQEANELIAYVDENIDAGEFLYLYHHAIPTFAYKNEYRDYVGVKNLQKENNIIYGAIYWNEDEDLAPEIDIIRRADRAYVLFSHLFDVNTRITPLIHGLTSEGYFELVMLSRGTLLYFFTADLAHVKTNAEYELLSSEVNGGSVTVEMIITNTGETIWPKEDDVNLGFHGMRGGDVVEGRLLSLNGDVYPGDEVILKGSFEVPSGISDLKIGLVREGKYWFRDIGVEDLVIDLQ